MINTMEKTISYFYKSTGKFEEPLFDLTCIENHVFKNIILFAFLERERGDSGD